MGAGDAFAMKISDSSTPTLFVPVIISSSGIGGSFYTSELTLTNRGAQNATVELTYVDAFVGGSGTVTTTLAAGQQRIVPDAIEYLVSLGIPVPATGNRGGTLRVSFTGLSSPSAGAVTVRTTTAVASGRTGSGLSWGFNVAGSHWYFVCPWTEAKCHRSVEPCNTARRNGSPRPDHIASDRFLRESGFALPDHTS